MGVNQQICNLMLKSNTCNALNTQQHCRFIYLLCGIVCVHSLSTETTKLVLNSIITSGFCVFPIIAAVDLAVRTFIQSKHTLFHSELHSTSSFDFYAISSRCVFSMCSVWLALNTTYSIPDLYKCIFPVISSRVFFSFAIAIDSYKKIGNQCSNYLSTSKYKVIYCFLWPVYKSILLNYHQHMYSLQWYAI